MTLARRFEHLAVGHPRVLTAMVAASALLLGIGAAGLAAIIEAETRAELNADVDRLTASVVSSIEMGRAVVASHLTAAVCVAEASARLAPATDAGARFTTASRSHASTVVQRAGDAAPVPAYDPAPPLQLPPDAGVEELEAALASLRGAEAATKAEVAALASTARATEQECASARKAVTALVDEISRRTDELIAANPKAAPDLIATLTVARDAVVGGEGAGIAEWIAAAGTVESSHAAAVLAEQQAADAARQAALRSASQADGMSGGPVTFFDPNRPPSPPRELSDEEFCQLVPSACTNGAPTPLELPAD